MAKIHPSNNSSCFPSFSSQEKEKYTVWMKSLVLHSHGCTVYDSSGNLVYRIDNYDDKCSRQVYLMDHKGEVLCTLMRKKLKLNEQWNGYKCDRIKREKPWFQVKKTSKLFNKKAGFSCEVTMRNNELQTFSGFKIQGSAKKFEFQIISSDGIVVAKVMRKQGTKGVMLGDDVLSMEVEPHMDRSLIMALVVVRGLMSHLI